MTMQRLDIVVRRLVQVLKKGSDLAQKEPESIVEYREWPKC